MTADDIIKIINVIPEYIRYIYPGYLVMYLYSFFRGYTIKDGKNIIIKSVAISVILNLLSDKIITVIRIMAIVCMKDYIVNGILDKSYLVNRNTLLYNFILILGSTLAAYISYRFIESERVSKSLKKLHIITSTCNNEIKSLKKDDEYVYVRIYLKEEPVIYEGYLVDVNVEHDTCKAFIIIDQYSLIYIDKDNLYAEHVIKNYYNKKKEKTLIYFEKIDRIEKCGYKRIDNKQKSINKGPEV